MKHNKGESKKRLPNSSKFIIVGESSVQLKVDWQAIVGLDELINRKDNYE